jgi:hypothetical protein
VSQISEFFWESIEHFLARRAHLITGELHNGFLAANAARHAQAVLSKSKGLETVLGLLTAQFLALRDQATEIYSEFPATDTKGSMLSSFKLL